eukprot:999898-Lingulodinium_polyedra.AAC.1
MITFDGGAHEELGYDVAAGAAIAFGRTDVGRGRRATTTWIIPEGAPSGDAECWAAKMALDILEQ